MTIQAQFVLGGFAIALWLYVLYLLGRKRLVVDHAVLWSTVCAGVFLAAVFPSVTEQVRRATGASSTLAAVYFIALVFVGGLLVFFSSQISILRRQVKRLAQELALTRAQQANPDPDRTVDH